MDYTVSCEGGVTFKTTRNFTMVFLPIPYNWGKLAFHILQDTMTARNSQRVAELTQNQGNSYPLEIFETEPRPNDHICSAVKSNFTRSGIHQEKETFSVDISCNMSDQEVFRDAVSENELTQYMADMGLKSVFQFTEQSYNDNGVDKPANPVEIFRNR